MSKTNLVMPPISSENKLHLHESAMKEIWEQLKSFSSTGELKNCEWCEENNWKMENSVYTTTVFDLLGDFHVHNKVNPIIIIRCNTCGNIKSFDMEKFGYTTKGGISKNAK